MIASVEEIEERYKRGRNAVYVWEAIERIDSACRILERPVILPDWIIVYLTNAAVGIVGGALGVPDGDRHTLMPPTENPDGTRTHYSDHFRGLTASQRRDVALEALGFKGSKGKNVLQSAYRERANEIRLAGIDALKRKGLSPKNAAQELDDTRLKMSADPARKIRRDRKKLSGER